MNVLMTFPRVRTRIHYGTDLEVQYSLRGHGLPIDSFPVDVNGNIRRDILKVWFYKRRAAPVKQASSIMMQRDKAQTGSVNEEEMDDMDLMSDDLLDEQLEDLEADFAVDGIDQPNAEQIGNGSIVPTENDVLLGRGRGVQHHEGNVRFRKILEEYRLDYDPTPRKSRRQYSAAVTHHLLGNGIRFLEKAENGEWVISSFEEADRKVGQL